MSVTTMDSRAEDLRAALSIAQGTYYALSGVWPLLHMRSFLAVTGPKQDLWLVRTVGALLGVTGTVLLRAGRGRRVTPEIRLLATGSAAVLAAVDTVYVARRRIPPVYLLDAAAEIALLAAWTLTRPPTPPA